MFVGTLTGFVGRDPETRYTAQGKIFSSFSLAHNVYHPDPDGGEGKKETEWIRVTGWGSYGQQVEEYIRKGMRVTVHGHISVRRWTDREDVPRFQVQMNVINIDMDRRMALAERAAGGAEGEDVHLNPSLEEAIDSGEYEETLIPGF